MKEDNKEENPNKDKKSNSRFSTYTSALLLVGEAIAARVKKFYKKNSETISGYFKDIFSREKRPSKEMHTEKKESTDLFEATGISAQDVIKVESDSFFSAVDASYKNAFDEEIDSVTQVAKKSTKTLSEDANNAPLIIGATANAIGKNIMIFNPNGVEVVVPEVKSEEYCIIYRDREKGEALYSALSTFTKSAVCDAILDYTHDTITDPPIHRIKIDLETLTKLREQPKFRNAAKVLICKEDDATTKRTEATIKADVIKKTHDDSRISTASVVPSAKGNNSATTRGRGV